MEGKTVKLQIVSIDITDIYIHSFSDLTSWFVSGCVWVAFFVLSNYYICFKQTKHLKSNYFYKVTKTNTLLIHLLTIPLRVGHKYFDEEWYTHIFLFFC